MKPMSIRDIVGPIMVGPSSSHTAGALRIASMVRNLLDGEPVEVTFTLFLPVRPHLSRARHRPRPGCGHAGVAHR